jgi:hypothetical protein
MLHEAGFALVQESGEKRKQSLTNANAAQLLTQCSPSSCFANSDIVIQFCLNWSAIQRRSKADSRKISKLKAISNKLSLVTFSYFYLVTHDLQPLHVADHR